MESDTAVWLLFLSTSRTPSKCTDVERKLTIRRMIFRAKTCLPSTYHQHSHDRIIHGQGLSTCLQKPIHSHTRDKPQNVSLTRDSINRASLISGYNSSTFLPTQNLSFQSPAGKKNAGLLGRGTAPPSHKALCGLRSLRGNKHMPGWKLDFHKIQAKDMKDMVAVGLKQMFFGK